MNIDAAIKSAQERIHRSVGQRARAAKRAIAEVACYHRARILYGRAFPRPDGYTRP